MTAATIREMLQYLPEEALTTELGARMRTHVYSPEAEAVRFAQLYSAPDFGWTFTKLLHQHGLEFPGGVCFGRDEVLYRAFLHQHAPKKYRAPDVQAALAIRFSMSNMRYALEGLLLSQDVTLESAAATLRLDLEVVTAYERLFFNVLDRVDDVMYLQQIVYPYGRMVEMMEGYLERESLGAMLRRAGHNNGPDDVLFLLGAKSNAIEALQAANTGRQFENVVMAYGYMMARNGGVAQHHTAVNNARQLLQAGKLGGDNSSDMPITAGLAATLDAEIRQYARPANKIMEAHAEMVLE